MIIYRETDYRAALERWNDGSRYTTWRPNVTLRRRGLLHEARWVGPYGGKHRELALTQRGALKQVKRQLARWTRALRRAERRRRVRARVRLFA